MKENRKLPLIAAHQGVAQCGYILGNTLDAFDIALKDGADIIELDAALSADGEVFTFHPGTEPVRLNLPRNMLAQMKSEEIRELRLVQPDKSLTYFPICTLEESLRHLKGRCYINVDKSWTCLPQIMEVVRRVGVSDQVILKSNIRGENWKREVLEVEQYAPDVCYMPVFYEEDTASEFIESRNVRYFGAEVVFKTEESMLASEAYIDRMHEKGRKLWVNAIVFNYRTVLSAGHTDDISLKDPELGWGWMVRHNFDIIQTDWVLHCRRYLDTLK